MRNLKAFFIGVIGKEDSIYRRYSDIMLSLCQIATECLISSGYNINIDRHDSKREQLISKSIINNIISADMFFVLADYLFWDPDNENNISQYKKHSNEIHWGYNPNVWFEYGLAATTNKSVIMIKCNKKSLPFNSQEIHAIDVEEHDIKFLLENLEDLPCHPVFNNIYNSVKNCTKVRIVLYVK